MSKSKVWYAPNKLEAYGDKEIEAVVDCLRDGWLAGNGPKTSEFEDRVSKYFGKKYGVFVNSGSSANLLALLSLKLEKGGEVITPACTFSTTVAPILQTGLVPVFCDVELNTYVPSVQQVIDKITPKTRVIMIPNLIGNKPNWEQLAKIVNILEQRIYLIEDSCDTMTNTTWTDISTTSFYASHLITAGGSGGMVMFNSEKHRDISLMYRDWGRIGNNSEDVSERFGYNVEGIPYDWKFLYGVVGYNFKSSEMNAAFGLVQLDRLEEIKSKRRVIFERYLYNLKDSYILLPDDRLKSDWLAIPLQYKGNRRELLEHLESNYIQTRVCFSGNITKHPAYTQYKQDFPNSDSIMAHSFLLGSHHGMSCNDVDRVCNTLLQFNSA